MGNGGGIPLVCDHSGLTKGNVTVPHGTVSLWNNFYKKIPNTKYCSIFAKENPKKFQQEYVRIRISNTET